MDMELVRQNKNKSISDVILMSAQLLFTIGLSIATLLYDQIPSLFGFERELPQDRLLLWILVFVIFAARYLMTFFYLMEVFVFD